MYLKRMFMNYKILCGKMECRVNTGRKVVLKQRDKTSSVEKHYVERTNGWQVTNNKNNDNK